MAKLKTVEELKKIRQAALDQLDLRSTAESEDKILVRVGMATCGIASGARTTMKAILDEIAKQGLANVSVTQTGCIGYCAQEPVVEVISKGMPSVLYGKVDENRGREIVIEHIKNGRLLQNAIINKSFENME
ncbi:(2Fe-2S) ferredoxin domain-containing protein [Lacrimispora xylanisolvens]|uniref:(2Fe-2S) ferredoxin domain-containing protein n=1 Tax=Lacrimispora xylanisolvens TaxID=384636 RepID=UPI00240283E1|nr:(2Fe-2S) ferredoxin domain-containing protein [Paenibacillaceae bacterium]